MKRKLEINPSVICDSGLISLLNSADLELNGSSRDCESTLNESLVCGPSNGRYLNLCKKRSHQLRPSTTPFDLKVGKACTWDLAEQYC